MDDQYLKEMYKLRDQIFELWFGEVDDQKPMFDAGFDAMLEIIELEIAEEERADMKKEKEELF
jgi:hypothetical protein